jgi:hypothetical protein
MRSWSFPRDFYGKDRSMRASRPSPSRSPARVGAAAASSACATARMQGLRQERAVSPARRKSRVPDPDLANPVPRPSPAAPLPALPPRPIRLTPPPGVSPSLNCPDRSNVQRARHEAKRSKTATLREDPTGGRGKRASQWAQCKITDFTDFIPRIAIWDRNSGQLLHHKGDA